ncbi:MAG: GAK system ATP-grasp enzyme [Thiomicrospira sp.]|jgi:ribosomal protein S6--L-glutamate ligase|nr:GAK system ATP-grasp enzyme [Thiomicrospira sp.]
MTKLRIGVIGLSGKWSTELLADAVYARTGQRDIIDLTQVVADLARGSLHYQQRNLADYDALIIKKVSEQYQPLMLDRLALLRLISPAKTRIFSTPDAIMRLVDRLACTLTLKQAGIPMPPTLITENHQAAFEAVIDYGQAILKPLYSTKAKGMEYLDARQPSKKLRQQLDQFHRQYGFYYVQKKLDLPGQDLGVMFLGGEYQGSYARLSPQTSWNTSTANGGKYAPGDPDDATLAIAQQAQALFELDYTTVDMAQTEDGPVCFEVSAFGGFKGAYEGLNINMAQRYVDYVIQQLGTN